jgi:hypothetical protein
MSSKFLYLVMFVVLSTGLLSRANATLIVGEYYKDGAGVNWEYVGSFDLAAGPLWFDANGDGTPGDIVTPLNGLDAASLLFGLPSRDLALAAFAGSISEVAAYVGSIVTGDNVVNHLAWYDGFGVAVTRLAENVDADTNNDNIYTQGADVSAYVDDRASVGDYENFVFKAVDIPEPSTLAIFALALFGLAARRVKKA